MAKLALTRSPGKRAVAYLRKSSDQQEASIPRQREAVHQYAIRHKYDIVGEYVDAGISGVDSSDRRTQFMRLVADAEQDAFDFAIAWDLSRITRSDPMETAAELRPLRRTGVKLVTTDRDTPIDWDTFAGQLILSIEAEGNNQYVRKLARNTAHGQMQKAMRGEWVAGRPPLGYIVGPGDKLQLGDPHDVKTIRWMFEQYNAGKSFRDLVDGLVERGYKRGISWVSNAMRNRLYTGDFVWGRNTQAKFYSPRDGEISETFKRGQTQESDQVVVRDNHPAIIDRELFELTQAKFETRKRGTTPIRGGGGFVLSGLLRCADCGFSMIGMNNAGVIRYRCGGSQQRGAAFCHDHLVTQKEVLAAVFDAFKERYANPEMAKLMREDLKRTLKERDTKCDAVALQRQMDAENGKLKKASQRLVEVDADLLPIVQDQIREIRSRISAIEKSLRLASTGTKEALATFDQRVERSMAMFSRLEAIYQDADPVLLRNFMREAVKTIRVDVSRRPAGSRYRYRFEGGEIITQEHIDPFSSW